MLNGCQTSPGNGGHQLRLRRFDEEADTEWGGAVGPDRCGDGPKETAPSSPAQVSFLVYLWPLLLLVSCIREVSGMVFGVSIRAYTGGALLSSPYFKKTVFISRGRPVLDFASVVWFTG